MSTLTGIFAGEQQSDNDVHHSTFGGSSDMNGLISWDDADGDGVPEGEGDMDPNCEYSHNCMEDKGTVKPSGVVAQVSLDFVRYMQLKFWERNEGHDWGEPVEETEGWELDDFHQGDEDLTPSEEDHIFLNNIYSAACPGFVTKSRPPASDYMVHVDDFKEMATVKIGGFPTSALIGTSGTRAFKSNPKAHLILLGTTQSAATRCWMGCDPAEPLMPLRETDHAPDSLVCFAWPVCRGL